MKIEKNSRQIPSVKKICSHKLYNDMLYSYLQYISEMPAELNGKEARYILKKDVKYTQIARILGVSRQSVATYLNNLVKLGLIELINDNKYELKVLEKTDALLLPLQTIGLLISALNNNTVSTYVYLLNRYLANEEKDYVFTIDSIKEWLGLSIKTKSNNYIIENILYVLQQIGLIDYEVSLCKDESGVKNVHRILCVRNRVK